MSMAPHWAQVRYEPAAVRGVGGDRSAAFADAPDVPEVIEGGAEVAGGADRAAQVPVVVDGPAVGGEVVQGVAVGVEVDGEAQLVVAEWSWQSSQMATKQPDAADHRVSRSGRGPQRWCAAWRVMPSRAAMSAQE